MQGCFLREAAFFLNKEKAGPHSNGSRACTRENPPEGGTLVVSQLSGGKQEVKQEDLYNNVLIEHHKLYTKAEFCPMSFLVPVGSIIVQRVPST